MAINIGNEAAEMVANLRGNTAFERLVDSLGMIAQQRMHAAMTAPPDQRVDQTSHARGVWEVWEALMMAYQGVRISEVKRPPQPKLRDSKPDAA